MDILLDKINGDLVIEDGDFKLENTDEQEIYLILISTYNFFKHKPFTAMNLMEYLNGTNNFKFFDRKLRMFLENDGFKDVIIDSSDVSDINISAKR